MVGKFVNFGGPSIFGGTGNIPDNLTDASGTVDAVEDTLAKAKQAFLQGDYPKALQDFMDISDGCPRANYFLGLMYQENLGTKVDNAVAKDYWQRGQQAGDKLCKICLLDKDDFLDSYDDEDDVEENLSDELKDSFFAFQFAKLCDAYGSSGLDADEIKRYFYESAEEHNALAYYELYKFYSQDNDKEAAKRNLENAAERNYPRALIKLGRIYENGEDGYAQDLELAKNYYTRAKEQKYPEANACLGNLYYNRKEYKSAFAYIKRAAKAGDTGCMEKLAYMYENGLGVKQSSEDAQEWRNNAMKEQVDDAPETISPMVSRPKFAPFVQPGGNKLVQQPFPAAVDRGIPVAPTPDDMYKPAVEQVFPSTGGDAAGDEMQSMAKSLPDEDVRRAQQLLYKLQKNYAPKIDELYLAGLKQRDATKKVVAIVTNGRNIPGWKWCPVETRLIAAANNSYAGKNLPFDVLAIFDDSAVSVPVFTGRSGIMLTSTKFICSQQMALNLADIESVAVAGNELSLGCKNIGNYVFRANRSFEHSDVIEELFLALAYTAKKYRS